MFNYMVFEKLCKDAGETTYQVCKDTGIKSSTIANWKKHSETSSMISIGSPDMFIFLIQAPTQVFTS